MGHPSASNGGFRPQELDRRRFQEAAAITIDKQAQAIQQTREFVADLSARLDVIDRRLEEEMRLTSVFRHRTFHDRLRWLFIGQ